MGPIDIRFCLKGLNETILIHGDLAQYVSWEIIGMIKLFTVMVAFWLTSASAHTDNWKNLSVDEMKYRRKNDFWFRC